MVNLVPILNSVTNRRWSSAYSANMEKSPCSSKGLFTNFEYITFFCTPPNKNIFCEK